MDMFDADEDRNWPALQSTIGCSRHDEFSRFVIEKSEVCGCSRLEDCSGIQDKLPIEPQCLFVCLRVQSLGREDGQRVIIGGRY